MGKKIQLVVMMFLQYAVWGAWYPVLSDYMLNTLGFNGIQVGVIYSLLPLATIISPFIGGQIADRYFATQKVIGFLQLLGGVFLIGLSLVSDYKLMILMMFLYTLMYAPTMALTNSITFHHLTDSEREFGWIRVGGTIGWIVIGLLLAGWRVLAGKGVVPGMAGDALMLAGIASIILGFYAFTLPNTPPNKEAKNPLAFVEAFKMLKNPNFAVFIVICFVVSTELMFYYQLTGPFLTSPKIGVSSTGLSGVMTIAQAAEIFVLALLLPYFLPKYGMRKTLTLGILAWPIRYIIFSIGSPAWLVIASLTLHGFCFVFFFAAAQIYVDTVAPKDIRASAQSMISFVTYGLGLYTGSIFAGWIQNLFSEFDANGAIISTNWTHVFLIPTALTVICAIVFVTTFREKLGSAEK
ncbi:MAG TPA: MFS transporter [bacterium]|nr:MFS transporter [bacterium]HPN42158.1 MFS transporter [bacterium]